MTLPSSAVSSEQFHNIDLLPVPEYVSAKQAALDAALVTAMEHAETASSAVLAHVLRCDVGSVRYKATLGV